MDDVSEAFGHLIYNNFSLLNVPFDIGKIVQGIQDAAEGKKPLITEKECIAAIHCEQEKKFKLLCQTNLKQAEEFLASNAKQDGMISLEGGKVQYKIMVKGKGAAVKNYSTPFVRFTVQSQDAQVLFSNKEESISLDETIPGLKLGLLGMREGEKRILYVHPDLAYKEKGLSVLHPNALLIFDIELLKADVR